MSRMAIAKQNIMDERLLVGSKLLPLAVALVTGSGFSHWLSSPSLFLFWQLFSLHILHCVLQGEVEALEAEIATHASLQTRRPVCPVPLPPSPLSLKQRATDIRLC